MRNRPWPVVLLALSQIISPFVAILLNSLVYWMSPWKYLASLSRGSPLSLVEFFVVLPLGGVAIYLYKRWSYFAFLATASWISYRNFLEWQQTQTPTQYAILVGITTLYVAMVGYFLLPPVRVGYFDKRARWWETKPRYHLHAPLTVEFQGETQPKAWILNLSEGGVFIQCPLAFRPGDEIRLKFDIMNTEVEVSGRVAYRSDITRNAYGVQFLHTDATKTTLRDIAHALKLLNVKSRDGVFDWKMDFRNWVRTLITTGKGWLPEVPNETRPDTASESKSDGSRSKVA